MYKLRILVCGGRHFENYDLLKNILDKVLKLKKLTPKDVEIVSGHCKGADMLGERWAEENECTNKSRYNLTTDIFICRQKKEKIYGYYLKD